MWFECLQSCHSRCKCNHKNAACRNCGKYNKSFIATARQKCSRRSFMTLQQWRLHEEDLCPRLPSTQSFLSRCLSSSLSSSLCLQSSLCLCCSAEVLCLHAVECFVIMIPFKRGSHLNRRIYVQIADVYLTFCPDAFTSKLFKCREIQPGDLLIEGSLQILDKESEALSFVQQHEHTELDVSVVDERWGGDKDAAESCDVRVRASSRRTKRDAATARKIWGQPLHTWASPPLQGHLWWICCVSHKWLPSYLPPLSCCRPHRAGTQTGCLLAQIYNLL